MAPRRFKNPLERLLYKVGHAPMELVEGSIFFLVALLLWMSLKGAGGFIEYGEPMVGVSLMFLALATVHGLVAVFRQDSSGLDVRLLLPVPFLVLALVHYLYLSPVPSSTWLVFAVYLQAYGLYILLLNSVRNRDAALWLLLACELVIVIAVITAFRQYYMKPGGWMLPGRIRFPGYAHGMAGYLQDPQTLASLILLIWPLSLMTAWMRRFPPPIRVMNAFCAAGFPVALLLCSNKWGLVVFGLQLLSMPVFLVGEWWMRRRLWAYGLGIVGAALGVFWFFTPGLQDRLRYLMAADWGWMGAGIQTGLNQFKAAPLTGQGLGELSSLWDRFSATWTGDTAVTSGSHILDLLAEVGLIGGILLVVPILYLLARAVPVWRSHLHVVHDQDIVRRFRHLSPRKRFRNKLVLEQSRTPSSKLFLGGLFPGLAGIVLYQLGDYSLRLPLHVFAVTCLVALLAVIGGGYRRQPANGITGKLVGWIPFGLAVVCCVVGIPRFKAQHEVFTATEQLQWLLAEPQRIFDNPDVLNDLSERFEQALKWDPGRADAWTGLGRCQLALLEGERDEPVEVARQARAPLVEALSLNPLSWEAQYSMARVEIMLDRPLVEVRPLLERAHQLAPGRPEPAALLGMLLLYGDRSSAEGHKLVGQAEEVYPDYPALQLLKPWLELSAESKEVHVGDTASAVLVSKADIARKFGILPPSGYAPYLAGLPAYAR